MYVIYVHLFILCSTAESEINTNAKIWKNDGESHNISILTIGRGPTNFTFDVSGACISEPNISLHYNDTSEVCAETFQCSVMFVGGENVSVMVAVDSYSTRFPEVGEYVILPTSSDTGKL